MCVCDNSSTYVPVCHVCTVVWVCISASLSHCRDIGGQLTGRIVCLNSPPEGTYTPNIPAHCTNSVWAASSVCVSDSRVFRVFRAANVWIHVHRYKVHHIQLYWLLLWTENELATHLFILFSHDQVYILNILGGNWCLSRPSLTDKCLGFGLLAGQSKTCEDNDWISLKVKIQNNERVQS